MPTYEFRCPDGHDFEKFYRSIGGAESVAACPSCGKSAERVMSAAGFAFKGSGFYLTDYGKNAHRGEAPVGGKPASTGDGAGAPSSSESKGESKGESKAESKGEGKAESKADSKGDSSASSSTSTSSDAKKSEPKPAAPKADTPAKKSSPE